MKKIFNFQFLLFNFWKWLSNNWYLLLCVSLLLFIEFYPKIPLFDVLPGYIVRVRIEDFLVVGACLVFGGLLLRRKVTLNTPITKIFIAYLVVVGLSIVNAMFFVKSIPLNSPIHLEKMLLHFARRVEYFTLFFLFYNAIKSFRHVRVLLIASMIMVLGVSIYGFGQKYLYWPVYSTMNREFSKGVRLVLTDHARVPSTFGGHYDMSAFIMFLLIVTLALLYLSKNVREKIGFLLVLVTGFWLLILGSSRSSFLAYLVGAGILLLLIGVYKASWKWVIGRGFLLFLFSLGVMVTFGDLSSRFTQLGIVQQINTQLETILHPVPKPTNAIAVTPVEETDQLPILPTPKSGAVATPIASVPPRSLPPDVYKNIPDQKVITATVGGKQVTEVVEVPRVFSDCSYVYGLSACIRFETLWPRAINGFLRNPLLGSGYSTVTKGSRDEFTEAESTDNDFLRTLGEIGLFGAITFYGPIFIFIKSALDTMAKKPRALATAVLLGLTSACIGLFFNALYIDVFAASKVAFMFWAMMGLGFAVIELTKKNTQKEQP